MTRYDDDGFDDSAEEAAFYAELDGAADASLFATAPPFWTDDERDLLEKCLLHTAIEDFRAKKAEETD